MFKCDFCKKTSKPNEKLHRMVTKVRYTTYANESFGTEVVEEKRACETCQQDVTLAEPEVVGDVD